MTSIPEEVVERVARAAYPIAFGPADAFAKARCRIGTDDKNVAADHPGVQLAQRWDQDQARDDARAALAVVWPAIEALKAMACGVRVPCSREPSDGRCSERLCGKQARDALAALGLADPSSHQTSKESVQQSQAIKDGGE